MYVYPGSGATCDTQELAALRAAEEAAAAAAKSEHAPPAAAGQGAGPQAGEAMQVDSDAGAAQQQGGVAPAAAVQQQNGGGVAAANGGVQAGAAAAAAAGAQQGSGGEDIEEDPDREFVYRGEPLLWQVIRDAGDRSGVLGLPAGARLCRRGMPPLVTIRALVGRPLPLGRPCTHCFAAACGRSCAAGGQVPPVEGPRVIDIGIPGFGPKVALWRRSWRDKIIPALVKFKPDMIFICAGGLGPALAGAGRRTTLAPAPGPRALPLGQVRARSPSPGGRPSCAMNGAPAWQAAVLLGHSPSPSTLSPFVQHPAAPHCCRL